MNRKPPRRDPDPDLYGDDCDEYDDDHPYED